MNDHEESQIAEVYENVKYFEKQRIRNNGNESVNGEKLSFKGRIASSKWDDSVINGINGDSNLHKEAEALAWNRSNTVKPFVQSPPKRPRSVRFW